MAEKHWVLPEKIQPPADLLELCGQNELVAALLVRRGLRSYEDGEAFLHPEAYMPSSPHDLPQMDVAVDRVLRAIDSGERICVWGDFDVDGQTSTALLVSSLRRLGGDVRFHIPVRAVESHGIKIPALQAELERGVDLLLTCDTGVTAHEAVDYAMERGVDVVITDHHDLPEVLPSACAVVNPKRLPCDHPMRELPGVGCAYKLVEALFEERDESDWVESLLDLVALGIVADVAVLRGDARYLVQMGLEVLRSTRREGLKALYHRAGVENPSTITEATIGYTIAPRMNALGRLSDANAAVEFLTTADPDRAHELAEELETLNAKRRMLVDHVLSAAQSRIAHEPDLLEFGALVLDGEGWPGGVVGIVASQLSELYDKPVVMLSVDERGLARGSARSIPGVDISSALSGLDDVLLEYGGHPMAAGMSLPSEMIATFRRRLSAGVVEQTGDRALISELAIDARLPWSSINLELVDSIHRLAPFGAGNPGPVFVSHGLHVVETLVLGKDRRHVKLYINDENGVTQEVLWWNGAGEPIPDGAIDLAYKLTVNTFRGQKRVQLEWVDAQSGRETPVVRRRPHQMDILDHRKAEAPLHILREIPREGRVIWAEGESTRLVQGKRRHQLAPAETLVIWTAPPDPEVLQRAVRKVKPAHLLLFAEDASWKDSSAFFRKLMGVIKHALLERKGEVDLERAAGACAATRQAVTLGLRLAESKGAITITSRTPDKWIVVTGGEVNDSARSIGDALKEHLGEIGAYRRAYRSVSSEILLADL